MEIQGWLYTESSWLLAHCSVLTLNKKHGLSRRFRAGNQSWLWVSLLYFFLNVLLVITPLSLVSPPCLTLSRTAAASFVVSFLILGASHYRHPIQWLLEACCIKAVFPSALVLCLWMYVPRMWIHGWGYILFTFQTIKMDFFKHSKYWTIPLLLEWIPLRNSVQSPHQRIKIANLFLELLHVYTWWELKFILYFVFPCIS